MLQWFLTNLIIIIFIKKIYIKFFYSLDNDKMEHSEAKLFTKDDLNDDLSKKYVKCKCVNNMSAMLLIK